MKFTHVQRVCLGIGVFLALGIALSAAAREWSVLIAASGQSAPCCYQMAAAGVGEAAPAADPGPEAVAMPDRGKKVPLGEGWFVYEFDRKPSMGTVIARVEVFGKGGGKETGLQVLGEVDMPSMRGAHSMGERPFQLNAKGTYLLPMGIVMPGEWEIIVSFVREGKVIYRGYHRFKV